MTKSTFPSKAYFGPRELTIREDRISIPEMYHMKVYRYRNGFDANHFMGKLHIFKGEFPAVILFDPLAVEEYNLLNRKDVWPCDLEKLEITQPHNRIRIPKHFKEHLRLESQVSLSCRGNQLRLWHPNVYPLAQRADPFDWREWYKAEYGIV